ncbi:MAG: M28 family peptidase [Lachnospiraceae bacterium]|nr:M28 family peptidase [Lachnospiraceae bacterium]
MAMLPEFTKYLDVNYALGVMDKLISFKCNPVLGYRSSGSAAEFAAADYLYNEMRRIGLKNVHKEAVRVDNFEFKNAELSYPQGNGLDRKVVLAALQANCFAENEEIELVYVGKGTEKDYEGRDVRGKWVLVDIDMANEWWVYWPLMEAKFHGIAGMIIVQVSGYCEWSEDTLGAQDISAPADTPCLSMTVREAKLIKAAIEREGGVLKCRLTADSRVTNNGITHNVIGEIPGTSDEVIYLIGHYDAYFTAFSDNPSGIGCMLGICKAFIESGYKPRRTLRVCMHGAEEWGIENTRYDWARGATMQVRSHPEWGRNGFLLLNLDGNLISADAKEAQVRTCYEMVDAMMEIGSSIEGNIYPFGTQSPLWTWTESYMYAMLGIPTVESWYEGVNFWPSYHSTSDQKDVNNYSDEAFLSSHILYGTMLQRFDALDVRPLHFRALFEKVLESCDENVGECESFKAAVRDAIEAADLLEEKGRKLCGLTEETQEFNTKVAKIFARIINELFGLDWYETYDFIHARNRNNIGMMREALAALASGDYQKAADAMFGVDLCKYGRHFDRQTYDFVVDQVLGEDHVDTWANDKVGSIADVYDVNRDIVALANGEGRNVLAICAKLDAELAKQREELREKLGREEKLIRELAQMMRAC